MNAGQTHPLLHQLIELLQMIVLQGGVAAAAIAINHDRRRLVDNAAEVQQLHGVAEDLAEIFQVGLRAHVPAGVFSGSIKTAETSPLDPGVVEYKYYAQGVGFIRGVFVKGGDEHTELISIGTCP